MSDPAPVNGTSQASEFRELVASRRMVRAFRSDPVDHALLAALVDTASRSPSAGKTQGWNLVVLEGAATETFWSATMTNETRVGFRWRHLFAAPMIVLSFADPQAYLDRYSESDKSRSQRGDAGADLGNSLAAWPAPYWTIDASFATMTLLLAAHDAGLGALFFGVFRGEEELRRTLEVPPRLQLLGAIALGYERMPTGAETNDPAFGRGLSAARSRAATSDIIHYGAW
ncbi:MAG: nitroreductase family protein [Actinomycetota bacterium]